MTEEKTIGDLSATFEELDITQFGALRKDGLWHVMAVVSFGPYEKGQVVAECGKSLTKATAGLIDMVKVLKGNGS